MKYSFLILFFSLSLWADSPEKQSHCHMSISQTILYPESLELKKHIHDFLSHKRCSKDKIHRFVNVLKNNHGNINLDNALTKHELNNIKVNPSHIYISSIEELLKSKLTLPENRVFANTNIVGTAGILTLENHENLKIECKNCQSLGLKNIKISFEHNNKKHYLWLRSELKTFVTGLVSLQDHHVDQSPLGQSLFKQKEVITSKPEQIVQNIENLQFFRLNQTLSQGSILKRYQISPLPLVRSGSPVSIELNNSSIQLRSKATALSNGTIGQIIRLRQPQTNKIITGEVIDFNKVKINL